MSTDPIHDSSVKLVMAIQASLDAFELVNATHLAELLFNTHLPKDDDSASYWLARCHFARNRPAVAAAILSGCHSLASRLLHAKACLLLGDLKAATDLLVDRIDPDRLVHVRDAASDGDPSSRLVEPPTPASVLYFIGEIFQSVPMTIISFYYYYILRQHRPYLGNCFDSRSNKQDLACHCYKRALTLNPFLWDAFDRLCKLGGVALDDPPSSIFKLQTAERVIRDLRDRRPCSLLVIPDQPAHDPPTIELPDLIHPSRNFENRKRSRSQSPEPHDPTSEGQQPSKRLNPRSSLCALSVTIPSTGHRHGAAIALPRIPLSHLPVIPVHVCKGATTKEPSRRSTSQSDGLPILMTAFAELAELVLSVHWHRQTSVIALETAPALIRDSALAHRLLGTAFKLNRDYVNAHIHFAKAHVLHPWDPSGMDMYSTVLWTLQLRDPLRVLASTLHSFVPTSYESLVAKGNLESIEGNHEKAVEALKAAGVLGAASGSGYPWEVCGHEFLHAKSFDEALYAFHNACVVEPSLSSAWLGIGDAYTGLGEHALAYPSYVKAANLLKTSFSFGSVGYCLESQGRLEEALTMLQQARDLGPKPDAVIALRLAVVNLKLGRFPGAILLLNEILENHPREPDVHYLLGFAHHVCGDLEAGLIAMTDAQAWMSSTPLEFLDLVNRFDHDTEANLNVVLEACVGQFPPLIEIVKDGDPMH